MLKFEDIELNELFPGEAIQFGSRTIKISPLGIEDLISHIRVLTAVLKTAIDKGINESNWSNPDHIPILIESIFISGLPLLENATGIDKRILEKTPPLLFGKLVGDVIRINSESLGGFEKNLKPLTDLIRPMIKNYLGVDLKELFQELFIDASDKGIDGTNSEEQHQTN